MGGGFVIAWTDRSQSGGDTESAAIRGQLFAADGRRQDVEFLVNTTTAGSQSEPAMVALLDGRFVIAWTDASQTGGDSSSTAIRAQLFTGDGRRDGSEFLVNTTTFESQSKPVITTLADGRFVIAWTDASQTGGDTSSTAIRAQLFTGDGRRDGSEFLVNTTTLGSQEGATIAALPDGGFVIAWSDASKTGEDTSSTAIRAQLFAADGQRDGVEFPVNSTSSGGQSQPAITTLADGRFVIVWSDPFQAGTEGSAYALRAQIFDPRTSPVDLIGGLDNDDFVGTIFQDTLRGFFGNDRLRGGSGGDRLYGGDGNDSLIGDAGNDILMGAAGNDVLSGGLGSDRLVGGTGNDVLNGDGGNDLCVGGPGDDSYMVDTRGDRLLEKAGISEGQDEVVSAKLSLDLNLEVFAHIENARLLGSANLRLTGSAAVNVLTGNEGDNLLNGNGGADMLTGLGGADRFVLTDPDHELTLTDFLSGSDSLLIRQRAIPIGNRDTILDRPVRRDASGGFSTRSELVIFTADIVGGFSIAKAANAIGSATSSYRVGDTRLFAVDNGGRSRLFHFTAANADAVVSAAELTPLANLLGAPALAIGDLQLMA